jgi:hypothetical protein
MKPLVALLLICAGIQGCSLITRPLDMPVIEEKLNRARFTNASVGTLSLTPERRVVLVNFSNNRFCAEAPTEIGIDVAALNKLKTDLSQGDKKAGLEYVGAASNQNAVLNKRTQGVQLFLANSYFACQMYMNGGIDAAQLLQMQFETLKIAVPLIRAELKYLYKDQSKETDSEAKATDSAAETQGEIIKKQAEDLTNSILNEKNKNKKPEEAPQPTPGTNPTPGN